MTTENFKKTQVEPDTCLDFIMPPETQAHELKTMDSEPPSNNDLFLVEILKAGKFAGRPVKIGDRFETSRLFAKSGESSGFLKVIRQVVKPDV